MIPPYPPYEQLVEVVEHANSASATFLQLWSDWHTDQTQTLIYTRMQVEDELHYRWVRFIQDLQTLARIGLLDYQKSEDGNTVFVNLLLPETFGQINGFMPC